MSGIDAKADQNKRKHRVSFEEAQTVFYDERGVLVEDEDEEMTGLSSSGSAPLCVSWS